MFSAFRKASATVLALPATISIACIRLYQRTLSPDHGFVRHLYPYGFCRHELTCSEYAISVFRTRNFFVAAFLTVKRVASCNPWTKISDEKLKKAVMKTMR